MSAHGGRQRPVRVEARYCDDRLSERGERTGD
jgi:hypothetical protein